MHVLMINGGASDDGCTAAALTEVAQTLSKEGISSEVVNLGKNPQRDCIGCQACRKLNNRCVFDDDIVNRIIEKAESADGFVFASPVYYAHPSGRLLSVLDRAFYAGGKAFAHKPGAAVVSARRGGTTASIDVINKYFTINQMPVISSTYWNMVHGSFAQDIAQDREGIQTMHNIALNMAYYLKMQQAAQQNGVNLPDTEKGQKTNFIR